MASNNNLRRSSTDTRRSSVGDVRSSFRSFSMSFTGNKLDLPLRYIDIKSGHDSGSTLGSSCRWNPKRTSSSRRSGANNSTSSFASFTSSLVQQSQVAPDDPSPNEEWTATERAHHVASDSKLHSQFLAEVKKSGVVTAAGYKAVHEKFIYSAVVEQERFLAIQKQRASERRPTLQKRGSNRFGGLVRSLQNNSQRGTSGRDLMKRSSLGGGDDSVDVNDTSRDLSHINPQDIANGSTGEDNSDSNIAPRRSSMVKSLTDEEKELLLKQAQDNEDVLDIFLDSIQDSLVRSHNSSSSSSGNNSRYDRKDSGGSLVLADVFDGTEGTALYEPFPSSPFKKSPHCFSDDETAPTYTRLDSQPSSIGFGDVDFDPEEDIISGSEDKTHYLPWPDQQDIDDEDDMSKSSPGGDLLESFRRRASVDSVHKSDIMARAA